MGPAASSGPTRIDRYELYDEIASGGMATVHLGRLIGPAGFGRTVAIKRLHPHLAKEAEFVTMLTDEARVAGRLGHPNIVSTLDIVTASGEVFLIMDYVPGLTLSALMKQAREAGRPIPLPMAMSIMVGVLHGLHAVHEARDEHGVPLEVVHRDVSPQNILVGTDGVARVLDFGIAKAAGRLHTTRDGQLKGKLGYMSPEQLGGRPVDRRTDIYAAAVVLWEVLTGARLFEGDDAGAVFGLVMQKKVPAPSALVPGIPAEIDETTLRGLERDPARRFTRARDMALTIEGAVDVARSSAVGEWVAMAGEDQLDQRARMVADIEAQRSRATTAVLSNMFERPDGFHPTVIEAPAVSASSPKARRGRAIVAMAGASLALATAAVLAATRGPSRGGVPQPGLSASALPLAPPALATPAEPSPTAAPPTGSPDRDPRSAATLLPPAAEEGSKARSEAPSGSGATEGRVSTRPPARPPRGRPPAPCDPPFTIDSDGHKHYKLNCL